MKISQLKFKTISLDIETEEEYYSLLNAIVGYRKNCRENTTFVLDMRNLDKLYKLLTSTSI